MHTRHKAAALAVLAAGLVTDASADSYTAYPLPAGALRVADALINEGGAIAGTYIDRNSIAHGFVRSASGTFARIDFTGATAGTYATGLTEDGTVYGYWLDAAGAHGYVRTADGKVAPYALPGAEQTQPMSANVGGSVTGSYVPSSPDTGVAFVATPDGNIATFGTQANPRVYAVPSAINDRNDVVGSVVDPSASSGFLRTVDGGFTTFTVPLPPKPGATGERVSVTSVNNERTATGYAFYETCNEACAYGRTYSYVRTVDGQIQTFSMPSGIGTYASAISPRGVVVGYYNVMHDEQHGFVRDTSGNLTDFSAPGAESTHPIAINDAGVITGYAVDRRGMAHGFIRQP